MFVAFTPTGRGFVPLDEVEYIQSRAAVSEELVGEYAGLVRAKVRMPRGQAVKDRDGGKYWVFDGQHRGEARRAAGKGKIELEWMEGTREDAEWLALRANTTHGLRRTNQDKQKAVARALALCGGLEEMPSAAAIADWCQVSQPMVSAALEQLRAGGEVKLPKKIITRGGLKLDPEKVGKGGRRGSKKGPGGGAQEVNGVPPGAKAGGEPKDAKDAPETPERSRDRVVDCLLAYGRTLEGDVPGAVALRVALASALAGGGRVGEDRKVLRRIARQVARQMSGGGVEV